MAASDAIIIRSRQFRSSRTLFFRQSYAASSATASGAIGLRPHAELRGDRAKQMIDECRDIGQPLAQRRHAQRVHVEPIVEILPKAARLDLVLEIAVRRRDDARRDRDRAVAADARHLPVFEHAQQLGLRRQRQLSDLVEEQCSVARVLERAPAQAIGAGKRAALVAEQLALDELLGQRRAVHRDQRRLLARSQPMQFARDQFLARAAFADDQDAARNRRDTRDRARSERIGALSPMSDVSPSNRDCSDRSSLTSRPRETAFSIS